MKVRKAMLWCLSKLPKKKMKRGPNVDGVRKLDTMLHDFKSGAVKLTERMREEGDTEFWVCLYFVNREQREKFLELLGIESDEKYVSAAVLAEAIGAKLADATLPVSCVKTAKSLTAALKPIPRSE